MAPSWPQESSSPATLAQRSDLPPRVRSLLTGLLAVVRRHFERVLPKMLDEFGDSLFASAERAPDSARQQHYFEALREFKRGRAVISPRFFSHLEASLARLRGPSATPARAATLLDEPAPLQLVDSAVLDVKLALRDIAGRAEIRHSEALYLLAHRIAVLGAMPVPPGEELPLGPAAIMEAWHDAIEPLDFDAPMRVLAMRHFEQKALPALAQCYAAANAWLEEQGILRHLRFQANLRRGPAAHGQAGEAAGAAGMDAAGSDAPQPAAEAPEPGAGGSPPVPGQHPRMVPAGPPSHAAPRASGFDAAATFDTLRHLLEDRRRLYEGEPEASDDSAPVSSNALQEALEGLQRKPTAAGSVVRQDSEHLKNLLLVRLRRASTGGRPLRLGNDDADTIDLVGMLFDHIAHGLQEGNHARSLLSRLQVPVLRVALEDKEFFTRRDHPARELLNAIAETSARWVDDDADPALISKLQGVVERVTSDFDGDLNVFADLLGDLNRYLQTLTQRAELAERRHVEAARGRDKLELACGSAREAIRRVIEAAPPDPVVRVLLERAWTDVLALSALRHGAGSDEFRQRTDMASRLAADRTACAEDPSLREVLETGLREVGLHNEDVGGVLRGLGVSAAEAEEVSGQLGEKLEARQRLGGANATPEPAAADDPPLNEDEAFQLAQLRRIAFGTWFEFVVNQQGERVRRKLAWHSPVSGRCLFVNQRGAQDGAVRSLEQLAREMVRGQVRIAPREAGSLIDRAWNAIANALRLPNRPTATLASGATT